MERKQINNLINKYDFLLEETHISWVLIGKEVVYKIKKPVNFGFLDYSTLAKRLGFCKKEIELNRRLAADMYIGISTIVEDNDDVDIDKAGKIIDYAVKMKRIPQDRMMDKLIKHNAVSDRYMMEIARIVSDFHKRAETNNYISSFGSVETNKNNTDENFKQTKDAIGEYITAFEYETIKNYTDDFYKHNAYIFEQRIKDGKIRDCHGDMYSRNICIISEKMIYIYDCIEFNERFRYSDIASDVAFLIMDLENFSRYDLARSFYNYYLEYSQDSTLDYVLNFYKIYRAYVRGKISFFQKQTRQARLYFDLSFGYLLPNLKPKLVMICGLTGAGKSKIAENLSKHMDAVVLSSDKIRKQLAGMDVYAKDASPFGEGIYSSNITQEVYEEISRRAYDFLREGKNVIIDATFLKKLYRDRVRHTIKRLGIEPMIIFVEVDDKTAKNRLEKRQKEKNASDGRWEIYLHQKAIFEKPKNCITLNAQRDVDENVDKILRVLKEM